MKYFTAAIIVLIALTALVGWTYDVELLKRFDLRLVAMNPITALCLLMGTTATLLGHLPTPSRRVRAIAFACAGFCIATGALKLTQLSFGWQTGPDTWLFTGKLVSGPGPANRMAPNTATNFFMIGIALVLLQLRRKVFAAQLIAVATALISMLAIVGYAYGIRTFYSIGLFIPMAVHTATSFLLLSGAVLYMRPTEGLMTTITNDGPAGRTARILLPCAIVLPIGLGWLRLLGQRAGMYESEVGVSIFVMSNAACCRSALAARCYPRFSHRLGQPELVHGTARASPAASAQASHDEVRGALPRSRRLQANQRQARAQ
jgi:hypothetical protein